MFTHEVFIGELLSVDRLAARTLHYSQATVSNLALRLCPEASDSTFT